MLTDEGSSRNRQTARILLAAVVCALFLLALPTTVNAAAENTVPMPDQHLERELAAILAGRDGSFGVAVVNLGDGRTASINATSIFPAASMYKLLVMYCVFEAIDRGDLSPYDVVTIEDEDVIQDEPDWGGFFPGDTPTVQEALNAMVTVSSNAAGLALTREVGGWGPIESAASKLGMKNTFAADDEFWSTPADMALFFQLLARGYLINHQASIQMIDLLLRQSINDRLPALLPYGAAVAHKTGELDDVRNDGGIVYGRAGWYVMVVMSEGGTPDDQVQVEAELSSLVYHRYGR